MTAPQPQRKILRIGIMQGGRITEEKLIPFGQMVTIGDGQKNTFVLHSVGLPNRFPLFVPKGNQYHLSFNDDIDGKLSMDGVVMGLDGVKPKSTKQKDGTFHFPLTEQVRGTLNMGTTKLLFQFVPAPVQPTRKALPQELSRAWLRQIDATYWAIFALTAVLHATVMLYALSLPAPKELTLEEVPDRFAKFIVPQKVKVEKKEEAGAGEEKKQEEEKKVEEKKEEKKTDKKNEAQTDQPKPQLDEAARRQVRKEQLKKVGILSVLGSRFAGAGGGGSAVADIISTGGGSENLESLMKSRAGGMVVSNSAGGLRSTGSDTGLVGGSDVGEVSASAEVSTKKRVAKVVPKVESGAVDAGTMDRATADTVIKKNLPGVTACYDTALKLNPSLKGKIYIDFTVEANGRVSAVNIRGTAVDQSMEDCIKVRVMRWKFPPSDEGVAADVSLPIVLTASS